MGAEINIASSFPQEPGSGNRLQTDTSWFTA